MFSFDDFESTLVRRQAPEGLCEEIVSLCESAIVLPTILGVSVYSPEEFHKFRESIKKIMPPEVYKRILRHTLGFAKEINCAEELSEAVLSHVEKRLDIDTSVPVKVKVINEGNRLSIILTDR